MYDVPQTLEQYNVQLYNRTQYRYIVYKNVLYCYYAVLVLQLYYPVLWELGTRVRPYLL